jgi:predicted nucleic acid-binding protein
LRGIVLADTGPLYAANDPTDSQHEKSIGEQTKLEAQGLRVVISYTTLQEAHGLVLRKLGSSQATIFLRDLLRTTVFIVPIEEDHKKAIRRVLRYPDQDISIADAINAEVANRLQVPVWTYDHHFDVMETQVWRA